MCHTNKVQNVVLNSINGPIIKQTHKDPPANTEIADTGSTGHFFTINTDKLTNIKPTNQPIRVALPDGSTIHSTHVGQLPIDALPREATLAHLFPSLGPASLVSIGQLCDAGCTALFTHDKVYIKYHGNTILDGDRHISTNKLWQLQLKQPNTTTIVPQATTPLTQQAPTPLPTSNLAMQKNTAKAAEMIKFAHASLFSPVDSTIDKALDRGLLTNFSGLTLSRYRN